VGRRGDTLNRGLSEQAETEEQLVPVVVAAADEREGPLDDPATSAVVPQIVNRVVTSFLGGTGAALSAEWLGRSNVDSPWSDRVLRRAFELSGGVPRVELLDADESVPKDVRERLQAELTLPA